MREEHDHHCHHDHEEDHSCHHDHEKEHCHHDEEDHEHHCHHDEEEHHHGEHEHHHDHDKDGCCGHDHHHHHADEVFTSWGKETPHKFDEEDLKKVMEILANQTDYGTILRAKGIVAGTDGTWMQFDLVPGEYEIRKGSPDYTGRLCVIGSELKTEELSKLFHLE